MITPSALRRVAEVAATDTGRGSSVLAASARDDLMSAVMSIAASRPTITMAICTGFYIPRAVPPSAETDGPLGAVQLAMTVTSMGGVAVIITDSFCETVVKGFLDAATGSGAHADWQIQLLVTDRPGAIPEGFTHALAIERPGRSIDGRYRNMLGEDISSFCSPLDDWFHSSNSFRIAIGDGGNEAGMGRLPKGVIESVVRNGESIRCVGDSDALIVGGTSNWAAHALSAALLSTQRDADMRLISEDFCQELLIAGVRAGAIDGVSARRILSVDGLEWDDYWRIPAQINDIVFPAN